MIKKILFIIIASLFLIENVYADYYSELIDKILCIEKQRTQREPIEIKLKGRGSGGEENITYIYITSVMKIKQKIIYQVIEKPKKEK